VRSALRARTDRRADVKLLVGSVLFDEAWYSLQLGQVLPRHEAAEHYLTEGRQAGLSPHPLFDAASIRLRWAPQRLAALGEGDPLCHYLREGAFGRSTHPLFDIARYLLAAPDARDHPQGPVAHYCLVGAAAGLSPAEWLPEGRDLREWITDAYRALSVAGDVGPTPAGDRVPGRCSVLVIADRADDAFASVRRLAGVEAGDREVVVLDNATPLVTAVSLHALGEYDDVRVLRVTERLDRAAALALLAERARGSESLLLGPGMRVGERWRDGLGDLPDEVAGIQPLLVQGDGTVRAAGWVSSESSAYPLLAGFPVEDATSLVDLPFRTVSAEALLLRTDDLRAASQDTLEDGPAGDLELCRRLVAGRPDGFRVAPDAVIAQRGPGPVTARPDAVAVVDGHPDEDAAWAACGFAVTGHDDRGALVQWVATAPDGKPRVRWAIKNAAPAGPVGEVWGDTHFARSLAVELRKLGAHVVIDAFPAWYRPTAVHDDVALVIRGPEAYRPQPGQVTISWVISHPDTVTVEEMRAHDRVVAASAAWAERMSGEWGIEVEPMLQATDADRFHPDSAIPDTGHELLFVGNTREEYRHVVRDAIESGLPLTIYGRGWQYFIDAAYVAGPSIANTELSAAYRAAGIVLSDHFEDMRRDGFASNRLFDAAASGARLITDEIAGIDGLFGDSVQVYRTRDDLVRLATSPDRDAIFGDDAARRDVAARIRREHSFDARARRLVAIASAQGAGG
jgi:hypothetical protein